MFGLFKKKSKEKKEPKLVDVNQQPLKPGDIVISYRYDLGMCKVIETETGICYESLETGRQESWLRMIDASTTFQKVRKLEDSEANIS